MIYLFSHLTDILYIIPFILIWLARNLLIHIPIAQRRSQHLVQQQVGILAIHRRIIIEVLFYLFFKC
ncbi:hypothetical protein D3C71_2176030 [compost metagenome]